MERGEIWWAGLAEPFGSGPGGRRPVLIVQADRFNRSAIQTTIVAAITGQLSRAEAPGNVLLTSEQSGLPRDSVVNVSQLVTVDCDLLTERVSTLGVASMRKVDAGLRRVLDLD